MSYILNEYDEALEKVLRNGKKKSNRTGTDTISLFGLQMRYDIATNFPLLTKRKIWPKSIFAEVVWLFSGSSNNKDLQALGSNVWTPWVDKKFEQENGYCDGSFGPVYGFQLRHFGGYHGCGDTTKPDYGKGGFDQLTYMMDLLRSEPDSRRILFSLWNPQQLSGMRLPPCHYTFQLYVSDDKLSGMLTQRSGDMPIGVPADIQMYSAMIYMFAQQVNLTPHEFIYNLGDAHIYEPQIPGVEEYLSRQTVSSPKLVLNHAKDIYSYKTEDFAIIDYNPLSPIKMPVEV